MRDRIRQLGLKLRRDGLENRAVFMIAYGAIFIKPEWSYRDILNAYADYVNEPPERVHAGLCYSLLAAGEEIGPECYINELKVEVMREN